MGSVGIESLVWSEPSSATIFLYASSEGSGENLHGHLLVFCFT